MPILSSLTILSPVPADSLVAEVVVSEDGPLEAGSDLTLTCIIHETISGLTRSPYFIRSSGPVTSLRDFGILGARNATTFTRVYRFSPLYTSYSGLYTCQGALVSPAAAGEIISTSHPVSVTVRRKLLCS